MALKIRRAGVDGIIQKPSGKKGRKAKPFIQATPETKAEWLDVLDKVISAFRTMQSIPPETIDYLLASRKAATGDIKGAEKVSTFRRMKDLSAAVAQIAEAKKANHKENLAKKRTTPSVSRAVSDTASMMQ